MTLFPEPERHFVHERFGGEATPADIAPYVFLPTDAHHVEMLAAHWENPRRITHHYEYLVYTGMYRGFPVTACSTGLGGVSTATALEELGRLGAKTFLHLGLATPLEDELARGDLVIATGAVRLDGASMGYARPEYPAAAHFEVVMAACAAAEQLGLPYRTGVVASLAASSSGRMDGHRHFLTRRMEPVLAELRDAGVLGGAGEEATMFVQAGVYGFRLGSINVCAVDKAARQIDLSQEARLIDAGLEAMAILMKWDQGNAAQGLSHSTPPVR